MKRTIFLLTAIVCSMALANAQSVLPNDPEVRVGKLDNGLTYYIRHNDKPAQRAEFYLATHAGAVLETADQDGLAHFLEHMCFNGLKNLPDKQMLDYFQSIGASFGGNINASTGFESTQYMLNNIPMIREGVLDTCLLVMHDYSHFVVCDPKDIDEERGVILEERRTRRNAGWRMYMEQKKYLCKGSKLENCSLIGSEENLKTFRPQSLVNYYQTWYRPDNQAVIVVGDVDPDMVENKLKVLFADIPAPAVPLDKKPDLIPDNEEPIVGIVTDPEANRSSAYIVWKEQQIPFEYRNTDLALVTGLLEGIIGRVISERLATIASKPDAPFTSAGAEFDEPSENSRAFMGVVNYANGEFVTAFRALHTEIEKMRRYGFSESEISRAKEEILSRYEKAATGAESRKNADFISPLISNFFHNTPYMEPQTAFDIVKQIMPMMTAQAVNKTVSELVTDENVVIIVNSPLKDGLEVPSEELVLSVYNETKQSEIKPNEEEHIDSQFVDPATLKGGKVKKTQTAAYGATQWILSNGVQVCVLPTDYKKDQVLFRLYKDGGMSLVSDEDMLSMDDNVLSAFQNNCGVSKYPADVVMKMLSGKQVEVTPSFSNITSAISGSCQPKDLETALQLMYLEFVDPRFDEDEFNTAIAQLKSVLPNFEKNPAFEFGRQFNNTVKANKARNEFISLDKLDRVSLKTIEKVYRQMFNDAAGVKLLIVGNVNFEELKPLVEKYIGSLPKGKAAGTFKEIDDKYVQGKVENHFQFAMNTPKATVAQLFNTYDIDYSIANAVDLAAADYVLDMVYVDVIREKEGGTYGVGTRMLLNNFPAMATIQYQFDTNVESASKLQKIALDELYKLAQNGPSEEYLSRTVEHFKKALPESRITNNWWMNALAYNYRYGLDYDALYEQAINRISAQGIMDILQKVLSCGNSIELIMTPAE